MIYTEKIYENLVNLHHIQDLILKEKYFFKALWITTIKYFPHNIHIPFTYPHYGHDPRNSWFYHDYMAHHKLTHSIICFDPYIDKKAQRIYHNLLIKKRVIYYHEKVENHQYPKDMQKAFSVFFSLSLICALSIIQMTSSLILLFMTSE